MWLHHEMQNRWLLIRIAALCAIFLSAVLLLLEKWAQIDRWAPIGASIGTILVSLSVVSGAILSFQKYIGTRFLQPTTNLELQLTLAPKDDYSLITVNVKISNQGIRPIVVRGDGTRETGSIVSYVSAVPISNTAVRCGQLVWKAEDEIGYLLDEQGRSLWINGIKPAEESRKFRQRLEPNQETELPFLIAVPRDTVAARVRAQIYVEDKHGRNGDYVHADKVVHATEANSQNGYGNGSTTGDGAATGGPGQSAPAPATAPAA